MASFCIRRALPGDAEEIERIEQACFSAPWSLESIRAGFQNETDLFYIAEADGTTTGYLGLSRVLDECYLYNLAVHPRYRRRGIARQLLGRACEEMFASGASFVSLEVRTSNAAAIALYSGMGFRRAGERKNFYSSPQEDAVIMTRTREDKEESTIENSGDRKLMR
ncbi:MAG TPA: ribosomal protein S18-alanine N-acetyltransferase [Candidatus Onthovicinus excrementipullorum]|nr:ribosomal protein S18-alanine N-acetyltransferase [Candidatus Onthovicinus excrementipullorum]